MFMRSMMIICVVSVMQGPMGRVSGAVQARRDPIYQVDGKGMARVEQALVKAKQDNKRVLLKIGGNWCGWCYKLHDVFHKNSTIKPLVSDEYELVMIDSRADKAVLEKWKIKAPSFPYLAVLDAAGQKLTEQRTGPLEKGSQHDPDLVQAFLEKWKAPPLDARTVLRSALALAQKEDKKVFVRIGAPWCGWCKRMDSFLAQAAIAGILSKDYVLVKIDQQRMTGAQEVMAKIRKPKQGGGIPWFAFLDKQGQVLITSSNKRGKNIGFPVDPKTEIPHFESMLRKTRSKITDQEIALVRQALTKAGQRFMRRSG
jgi:thiol-disulfide isomerase/thioredoxin